MIDLAHDHAADAIEEAHAIAAKLRAAREQWATFRAAVERLRAEVLNDMSERAVGHDAHRRRIGRADALREIEVLIGQHDDGAPLDVDAVLRRWEVPR